MMRLEGWPAILGAIVVLDRTASAVPASSRPRGAVPDESVQPAQTNAVTAAHVHVRIHADRKIIHLRTNHLRACKMIDEGRTALVGFPRAPRSFLCNRAAGARRRSGSRLLRHAPRRTGLPGALRLFFLFQ